MRKYLLLLALTALAFTARAQVSNPSIIQVPSTPSNCSTLPLQIVTGTNQLYGNDGSGGCSQVAAGGASATTSGTASVYPALLLPKWIVALAKAKTGSADAKVMFIGDSTMAGVGSTSLATTMPSLLENEVNDSSSTKVIQEYSNYFVQSKRVGTWALGTGWSTSFIAVAGVVGSTSTTWTPGGSQKCDTFNVDYLSSTTSGQLTITATGGTPVVVNTAGANGYHTTSATASTDVSTNVLTVSNSGGSGTVYVASVECHDSTVKNIRFANLGLSGGTTANFIPQANPFYEYNAMLSYAPDLTIISLGINDAGTSVPCATTIANLQTIINGAKLSGDVILQTVIPSQNAPYVANEAACYPSYLSLAKTNNIPLVDIYARWGSAYNAALSTGGLHPTDQGAQDWAGATYQIWKNVQ